MSLNPLAAKRANQVAQESLTIGGNLTNIGGLDTVGDISDPVIVVDTSVVSPFNHEINYALPAEQDAPVTFIGSWSHSTYGTDEGETIYGHDGLFGFSDEDYIHAGGGDDIVFGGKGDDAIRGGEGHDRLYGQNGNDRIAGGIGDDYIKGGEGDDTLYGEQGNDEMRGEAGNDYMSGGSGDDKMWGHSGDDLLLGGFGNDYLHGGDGRDIIVGGRGGDELRGGDGGDTFRFDAVTDSLKLTGQFDTILDFGYGDRIDFSGIDANEGVAGNQAFSFVNYLGPNQVLAAGQMSAHYDPVTNRTIIEANVDGDASHEFYLEIVGNHAPDPGNFNPFNFLL
jgi:Ca2+-binding RTX toxin-like protein